MAVSALLVVNSKIEMSFVILYFLRFILGTLEIYYKDPNNFRDFVHSMISYFLSIFSWVLILPQKLAKPNDVLN